jgi:nitroreductase
MDPILARRSIRRYTTEPVTDDQVEQLLRAAMAAPSAGNEQPWHFVVLRDHKVIDEIPRFHPYSHMLIEAQVAVVVCGDLRLEKYKGYWVQDCAAATENLLIAAQSIGLGAVWLGIHPMNDREEGLRELLDIPEEVVPFAVISIGCPGEEKPPADRYDEARIHSEKW